MRVTLSIVGLLALFASSSAFVPAAAPRGRSTEMILGKIFGGQGGSNTQTAPAPSAAGTKQGGRLNLKAIPKEAPKAKPVAASKAAPTVNVPAFSFGGAKKKAAAAQEVTARMMNGKLVGYFTEDQVIALVEARREIPSNAPQYWQKISAKVPGSTAETCKAMANQIALDKARGTKKNFFGGYVEVKETEMKVDYDATPMNRIKEAFGFKK